MNIFLTGATGFLGRTIAHRLQEDGHRITALLLPNDDTGLAPGCSVVRGDITNPDTLSGNFENQEAVVHLAGAVGYGQTWKTCINLNREGTAHVAGEAVRSGIRRFIHMSSVSVYGRVPDIPLHESAPMKKIGDPYGDTKIDAENLLNEMARQEKIDLTIIRPSMIYGPGDMLFLPKLIENLKTGTSRVIGRGDYNVDLIHVRDTAEFVSLILRSPDTSGHVYNLTHPNNPSWKTLLFAIAKTLDIPPPEKHVPYGFAMAFAWVMEAVSFFTRRPPRITRYAVRNVGRRYRYITDRMQNELGFMPSIDTLEGVCTCAREFMEQQVGRNGNRADMDKTRSGVSKNK